MRAKSRCCTSKARSRRIDLLEVVSEEVDVFPGEPRTARANPVLVRQRQAEVPVQQLLGNARAGLTQKAGKAAPRAGDAAVAPPSVEVGKGGGPGSTCEPDGNTEGVRDVADVGELEPPLVVDKVCDLVRPVHQGEANLVFACARLWPSALLVDVSHPLFDRIFVDEPDARELSRGELPVLDQLQHAAA